MDQEVSHSQSETPDQLEQDVIVIVTDTESENEQEGGDEEEEEQVEHVSCTLTKLCVFMCTYIIKNSISNRIMLMMTKRRRRMRGTRRKRKVTKILVR